MYAQLVAALMGLQPPLTALQLLIAPGVPPQACSWRRAGAGLLVMLAGSRFGKPTRHRALGIPTRWTISSDPV